VPCLWGKSAAFYLRTEEKARDCIFLSRLPPRVGDLCLSVLLIVLVADRR